MPSLRQALFAAAVCAVPLTFAGSEPAAAWGWRGYYGYYGGYAYCPPRVYGYSYYRPTYFYRPVFRPRYAYGYVGFYRPRVWGWRSWGWRGGWRGRGWRRW
jgi:hypothetical protein